MALKAPGRSEVPAPVTRAASKIQNPGLSNARDDVPRAFAVHFNAPKEQKPQCKAALDAALGKIRGTVGANRKRSAEEKTEESPPKAQRLAKPGSSSTDPEEKPEKAEKSKPQEWVLDGRDIPKEIVFPAKRKGGAEPGKSKASKPDFSMTDSGSAPVPHWAGHFAPAPSG